MATHLGDPDGFPVRASRDEAGDSGPAPVPTRGWLVSTGGETKLRDGHYVMGRDLRAHIRVHDPAVSRRHASITVAGDVVTVEDLGSRNGTWVNGVRLDKPHTLQDGDQLRVGGISWLFRRSAEEAPTQALFDEETILFRPPDEDEEVI